MQSYLTKKTAPQRMSRKRSRRDIFIKNKKETKLRRKAVLLANRERHLLNADLVD